MRLRQFIRGVCALPSVASIATREVLRLERDAHATRQWLDKINECTQLEEKFACAKKDRDAACANRDEFRRGEERALVQVYDLERKLAERESQLGSLREQLDTWDKSHASMGEQYAALQTRLDAVTKTRDYYRAALNRDRTGLAMGQRVAECFGEVVPRKDDD